MGGSRQIRIERRSVLSAAYGAGCLYPSR